MSTSSIFEKMTIFWFRQDLRIQDNPGLFQAAQKGPVMVIYILDDESAGSYKMGQASRWWLYHSLCKLNKSLDLKLNVYAGNASDILLQLIEKYPVDAVYWNRCYEPWRIRDDTQIKALLKNRGIDCQSFNGSLLWEPWEILKDDSTPYKVYTPFYNKAQKDISQPRAPLPPLSKISLIQDSSNPITIDTLFLLSSVKWYEKLETQWQIGEEAASLRLQTFINEELLGYKEARDYPSKENVSRLSPHLHFGEISPHQIWNHMNYLHLNPNLSTDLTYYLREIIWREFSYYLLYHFPDLPFKNFQSKFDDFPWQENIQHLKAWQAGQTGYPIIDAGMRELWQTGYMHNRIRMIVASFLVKNLLIHWHRGEEWFWDCLVDADLANNSASWQWVAGSGADASPYFRIFNPITQGEKFDPGGDYTRHFVPELSALPNKFLFKPWEADKSTLIKAGVTLGETYPYPIVDLTRSRHQALEAYHSLSNKSVN